MRLIDGRKISKKEIEKLRKRFRLVKKRKLVAINVGKKPANFSFLKAKKKVAEEIGLDFLVKSFPEKISQKKLEEEIESLNKNKDVGGIIIQLPLPRNLDKRKILDKISKEKDVDCLGSSCFFDFLNSLYENKKIKVAPPSVKTLEKILKEISFSLDRKNVILVGRGELIGKPLAFYLLPKVGSLTILSSKTKNKKTFLRQADLIITGVGKRNLIKGEEIKNKAVIIDFGFSKFRGKIFGDLDFSSVKNKASYLTPVPGGTGPILVTQIFDNFYYLLSWK